MLLLVVGLYCVTLAVCWARPHTGLGVCCTIQAFATALPDELIGNNLEWLLTLCLLVGIWRTRPKRSPAWRSGWTLAILATGAYVFIGPALLGEGTGSPFRHGINLAAPLLWGYLFGADPRARLGWLLGVGAATAANAIAVIVAPSSVDDSTVAFGRLGAITYYHTTSLLAGFLLVFLLSGGRRRLAIIGAPICLALLWVSFSRGAMLGVGAAVLLFPAVRLARSRAASVVAGAAACVVAVGAWSSGLLAESEAGAAAIDSYSRGFALDKSNEYRVAAAEIAFDVIADKPLLGIGTSAFWDKGLPIPHQLPISYALSYGLPVGAFAAALLLLGLARPLLRSGLSRAERWRYLGLALVNASVALTNGAMVLGGGLQWWAMGACLRCAEPEHHRHLARTRASDVS